jgi:predicted heme/steroid binding protein
MNNIEQEEIFMKKNNNGHKIFVSVVSLSLMFAVIYQIAFASTFGGGLANKQSVKVLEEQNVVALSENQIPQAEDSNIANITKTTNTAQTTNTTKTSNTADTGVKTFNKTELAAFDGKNGHPAYVAVSGKVYDLTNSLSWVNGQHHGLSAGEDLTLGFSLSPHSMSILKKSPIMGIYSKSAPAATSGIANAPVATLDLIPLTNAVSPASATQPSSNPQTPSASAQPTSNPQTPSASAQPTTPAKTWTLAELARYNGMNGNPAYIAVKGVIYDVTSLGSWQGGVHHGVRAGTDATKAFSGSPHSASLLKGLPVVGKLGDSIKTTTPTQTQPTVQPKNPSKLPAQNQASTQSPTPNPTNQPSATTQTWTLTELARYNGMNGNPAYIAVKGIIYDVTSIGSWQGGVHHGVRAGTDATQAFSGSPHSASLLNGLPVVGKMGDAISTTNQAPATVTNGLNNSFGDDYDDDESEHSEGEDD